MVDRFGLLDRERRALIVDDWHEARLKSKARSSFISMAIKQFGKVYLFSDPIFDIQELAREARDQATLLQFRRATLSQFGFKARGRLIEKWLTLGQERPTDSRELTYQIDEIENALTTLLGKNTLPKFPFIVLSVLEAYQEKKTARAEAGSYGYVYEVLITTALASNARTPADIDKKYTFLTHLAYRLFKSGHETLSYSDIVSLSEEYRESYGLRIQIDSVLDDLVGARVLAMRDGNYRFYYGYYLEYFVARYYKDGFQNPSAQTADFAAELSEMADNITWSRYSKILMFFLYFTKNSALIAKLVSNANEVFAEYSPANLEADVEFTNDLCAVSVTPQLPTEDVRANREEIRSQLDESERRLPSPPEERKVRYASSIPNGDKVEIAVKTLELLGQIIRNFPGSLKADVKKDIARCSYLLGLRTMSAVLEFLRNSVSHYRQLLAQALNALGSEGVEDESTNRPADASAEERQPEALLSVVTLVDQIYLLIIRFGTLGLIKKVSMSLGSPELDQTYSDILPSLPDSLAVRLIDLSIKLDHFRAFPENQIRDLNDLSRENTFGRNILADLVAYHLLLFEVDFRTRQSVASLLGLRASDPRFLESRTKLLK